MSAATSGSKQIPSLLSAQLTPNCRLQSNFERRIFAQKIGKLTSRDVLHFEDRARVLLYGSGRFPPISNQNRFIDRNLLPGGGGVLLQVVDEQAAPVLLQLRLVQEPGHLRVHQNRASPTGRGFEAGAGV